MLFAPIKFADKQKPEAIILGFKVRDAGLGFSLLLFGFCWSLLDRCFSNFFLWLVLAKLLWVASLAGLVASRLLNPSWKFNLLLGQDTDNSRSRLGAILEVKRNLFGVDLSFFGVWVKATHVGNHAAAAWVAT